MQSWNVPFRRQLAILFPARAATPLVVLVGMLAMFQGFRVRDQARAVEYWETYSRARGAPAPLVEPALLEMLPFLWLVGLGFGLLVWREESGDLRRYHWSLPVTQPIHDFARIGAGATWLLASVASVGLIGLAISALDGTWALSQSIRTQTWANALAAPLIAYLGASVFPVLFRRPLEWMVSVFAIAGIVGAWALDLILVRVWAFDPIRLWLTKRAQAFGEIMQAGPSDAARTMSLARNPNRVIAFEVTASEFALVVTVSLAITLGALALAVRRRP